MSIRYADMIAGLPDAYPAHQLQYQWQSAVAVSFEPGMTLSQFDLMGSPQRNFTFTRREGNFLCAFPPLGKWLGEDFRGSHSAPGSPLKTLTLQSCGWQGAKGQDQVTPLKTTTGTQTQDTRSLQFFRNLDSYISTVISQ